MRVLAPDVDIDRLARAAGAATLEFLPLGEDSFTYAGGGLFVRLQNPLRGQALEAALRTAMRLNLPFILRPQSLFPFGAYLAAVFPFIQGRILGTSELSGAGECLSQLHAADPEVASRLPGESFENPFQTALGLVCDSQILAVREREYVARVARDLNRLGEEIRSAGPEFVLTHGDPNTHNWIVDAQGDLHLCDWGDLGLGPRERDLFAFSEPHLQAARESYGRRLDDRILEFYRLRWILQEVADYGRRLLDPMCPHEEREHARAELERYTR